MHSIIFHCRLLNDGLCHLSKWFSCPDGAAQKDVPAWWPLQDPRSSCRTFMFREHTHAISHLEVNTRSSKFILWFQGFQTHCTCYCLGRISLRRWNIFTMKQLTSVHCTATKTPAFFAWEVNSNFANCSTARLAQPPTSSVHPPPSCRRWWGWGCRGRCRWRGWPRSPSRCPSPLQLHSHLVLPQWVSDEVISCKKNVLGCGNAPAFDNCCVTLKF